ncbi:hypothetical protein OBBRIDRAFT_792229 [Obba rivulosa]|uniref:Uncharacterized protein n=1 Tax=Obba rivulosa TaxID=1052685 RepID=A0A8E2B0K7_9APHY|nr:hypothetical protein OBBRIDRAFT_792229 [Obba rivulosa]
MGRPLFSHQYQTPAVRVEPEQPPTYEKWTYWNAFDPDSDEFFESEDAVYEAFVDPSQLPLQDQEDGRVSRSHSPPLAVLRDDSVSPASSSGRGTPMDDVQTVSVEEISLDTHQSGWVQIGRVEETEMQRDPMPTTFVESPIEDRVYHAGEMVTQYANMYQIVSTHPSSRASPSQPSASAPPFIRSPTYIDYASRPPSPPLHIERATQLPSPIHDTYLEYVSSPPAFMIPPRPVTPPTLSARLREEQAEDPSPPPTVTPRLYTWGTSRWAVPSASHYPPSPVPASPLAHRGVPPMAWVTPSTMVLPPSRVRG